MLCPTMTPVITVNTSTAEDEAPQSPQSAASDDEDEESVKDIGQCKLADLARRSLRIRRHVHLQLHRQRRRQQLWQLQEAKQIERLRRDKDILTNFMRLRLYETQSSFSGSDVASSGGGDRGSDSDRPRGSVQGAGAVADSDPAADDGRRDAGSVSGMSASTRAGGGGAGGGGAGETSARSRRREDLRNILRQRRHRRRLMLLSCGEGGVEQYTDKTRNAAVVMGEKDIKLSLKQQRRALAAARGFSLPACAHPSGLTAMARAHRRSGQPRAALQLTEQALLLDPVSKAALLERSQCYQQLGQPRLALLDAEDALDLDKEDDAAFLHKAHALYSMGHFEKALVMFHRGSRLRPENSALRAGIQRSREAIMNIIGCLPRDFALSSCERLLRGGTWPDEESSLGSARREAELRAGALGVLGALRGSASDAMQSVMAWNDQWAGAEDNASEQEHERSMVAGVCESCNTAHQYVDAVSSRRPPTLAAAVAGSLAGSTAGSAAGGGGVEEEARQIALILSVTNAHDGRNKHLREKLMVPAPSPAASPPASPRRRPLHLPQRRAPRHDHDGSSAGQPLLLDAAVDTLRPGADRLPPSLGRDAVFLQQIARDPRLAGQPVRGLAEEAVRFLKARQVFWQRRGPIAPGRPRRRKPAPPTPATATPTSPAESQEA